jgi:hypothetical protein
MSVSPQPQIQVLQGGAGSAVGSTVGAPTRVKEAGNSNLGTFGVCCILASCQKITVLCWLAEIYCAYVAVGQVWARPDAEGAHTLSSSAHLSEQFRVFTRE